MVHCTRCGRLNSDTASYCTYCGEPLQQTMEQPSPHDRMWRRDGYYGTQRTGALAALALGLIIILAGTSALLAQIYNIDIPWGGIVLIFVGILIIVAGLRARSRRRRDANI